MILKRCVQCSVQMPSKPVRTLEEREAAYAEARLRILGSAVSSDDEVTNNSCDNRLAFLHVYSSIMHRFRQFTVFALLVICFCFAVRLDPFYCETIMLYLWLIFHVFLA